MKKLFSLIVILVAFSSCTTDVKFNNPGFQAYKDDIQWNGIDVRAYKSSNGSLRIVALSEDGEIELETSGSIVGTYYLGSTANNYASYTYTLNGANVFYSSQNSQGPILNIANLMLSGGSGYTAANNAPTSTTGDGAGMKVKTIVNPDTGEVMDVKISASGSNYKAGDVMTISGGDNSAKFKILSEIKILDVSDGTVTGSFKFNGRNVLNNPLGGELVNFQYGAFYKIPVQPEP